MRCVKARLRSSVQASARRTHVLSWLHVASTSSQDTFVLLFSSQAKHATPQLIADKKGLDQNIMRNDTHANVTIVPLAAQCAIEKTEYLDFGV